MHPDQYVPLSEALYHAANEPDLGKSVAFTEGFCGACGRRREVAAAAEVFTSTFGSWGAITPDPLTGSRHVCLPCAWAYRAKELRHHPTIISCDGATYTHPSGSELRAALSRAIPSNVAILLPITGKKAVAPQGRWGMLTTDSGPLNWSRDLARHVRDLLWLKARKCSEPMLSEPAPPSGILDKLSPEDWTAMQEAWARTSTVRTDKTLYPALLKLSREKM